MGSRGPRRITRLLPAALATVLVLSGAVPAPSSTGVGDIRHVANIPYPRGTDLEFATKEVLKLDEAGNPVCLRAADGGCLRDDQGEVVYETERRDFAFAGRRGFPVKVIDITDPERPTEVAEIACRLTDNDPQVWGDLLIMGSQADADRCTVGGASVRSMGFGIADISDPRAPVVLSSVETPAAPLVGDVGRRYGSHNIAVHPTRPVLYSATQGFDTAMIPIWDFSDPTDPELVRFWEYPGAEAPHDITFNASGTRAYAASVLHTDILDTTDPRNPSLIATIGDPSVNIHHQADPTPDGRYLLISDELGGAIVAPACPGGGIHVFDLTVERAPVKVGAFWPDDTGSQPSRCTSHVFRINPDGRTLAAGWYGAGVQVFDFSDLVRVGVAGSGRLVPAGVVNVAGMALPNADTWAAKMWQERHPGYVFASDYRRGFDVFHVPALASEGA